MLELYLLREESPKSLSSTLRGSCRAGNDSLCIVSSEVVLVKHRPCLLSLSVLDCSGPCVVIPATQGHGLWETLPYTFLSLFPFKQTHVYGVTRPFPLGHMSISQCKLAPEQRR